MYLLEGSPIPDHATFARFESLHFASCAQRLMVEASGFLYDIKEISGKGLLHLPER